MLLFTLLAALLVIMTLGFLLWPLLRRERASPAPDADAATIAIFRDQKRQLDADCAAGTITPAERDAALTELARRVAEEVRDNPVASAAPVPRRVWPIAALLLLVIPAAAGLLYWRLGNPDTLLSRPETGSAHEMSQQQILAMVDNLARRLKQRPDDAEGWVLLARSYSALERFAEAAQAYEHAQGLIPDDVGMLADYADTLAMAQGRKLAGRPAELIQRALAIDGSHRKALALAATAAMEARDLDGALGYWRRLAAQVPGGSDEARQVASIIAEIETAKDQNKAGASAAAKSSPKSIAPAVAGAALKGRVDVSEALAGRVALNDTVFIFARATSGSRVPLAVLRIPAKELPAAFSLDDSMGMAPGVRLSTASEVIVEARISKSGDATPQPGDLYGRSAPVRPGTSGLAVTIDQVVP